jgi:hypothetical protein
MKLLSIFSACLLIIFSLPNTFAQRSGGNDTSGTNSHKITRMKMTIKNAPSFTLQFSGNYDYGVYELSGNNNGDFDSEQLMKGENFGVRHGIGAMVTMKIPLHEQGNLRLNISLMYNKFNSTFNKLLVNNTEPQFARYNVMSGSVGIENNFTPNYKIKTFIGGGIIASIISGNAKIYNGNSYNELTIKPAFRLGVSVYSGLEYMLNNKLGFNCGFRFTHANLWLKQSKNSDNANEIYLNDKRVEPRLPYSGFKQFAWGSFFCGLNVYFGISEKEYIYQKNR